MRRISKMPRLPAVFLLAGLLFVTCAKLAPTVSEDKTPVLKETAGPAKPEWEQKWDSTVAEAKKEGPVTLYSLWGPDIRIAVAQTLKNKYGIDVESSPFTRGSDLLAKVKAEQRAGLYTADIFGAGNPTLIVTMKPEGLLAPLPPLLILPEVRGAKRFSPGAKETRVPGLMFLPMVLTRS